MSLPAASDPTQTSHIRPQWLSVTARMQQAANTQSGAAVLTIKIVIGPDGNPYYWTEPEILRLEPKSRAEVIAALLGSP